MARDPREPLQRWRYRAGSEPPPPDRVASAVRAARLGAVLAAAMAVLVIVSRGAMARWLPFDPQFLVIAAFLAPIVWAFFRPSNAD